MLLRRGHGGQTMPAVKESIEGRRRQPARQTPPTSTHFASGRLNLGRVLFGEHHPELSGVLWRSMSRPDAQPGMTRKRGNPNWGRPMGHAPAIATEFEMQVRHLHLAPEDYLYSATLRV